MSSKLKNLGSVASTAVKSYLSGNISGVISGLNNGLKTLTAPEKTLEQRLQEKGNPHADIIMFSGCKGNL